MPPLRRAAHVGAQLASLSGVQVQGGVLRVSVVTRCSGCGAVGKEGDYPPCRHFRRNREIGVDLPVALGLVEAWFVRRKLRPPFWPKDVLR